MLQAFAPNTMLMGQPSPQYVHGASANNPLLAPTQAPNRDLSPSAHLVALEHKVFDADGRPSDDDGGCCDGCRCVIS